MRKASGLASVMALIAWLVLPATPSAGDETAPPQEGTRLKDISYGPDPDQTFDACLPKGDGAVAALVILLHGGGWSGGDKAALSGWCDAFAKRDVAALNLNYRLAGEKPGHVWPAQVEDIDSALAQFRQRRPSSDPLRICLVGFSAGGHLTLKYLDRHAAHAPGPELVCAVDNFGPIDLANLKGDVKRAVCRLVGQPLGEGCEPALAPASNLTADQSGRRILVIQGDRDRLVDVSQSRRAAQELKALGADVDLIVYPGDHTYEGLNSQETAAIMARQRDFVARSLLEPKPANR